jgi:hypothetical protein
VQRGAGIKAAGEGDADLLAEGERFEDYGHFLACLNVSMVCDALVFAVILSEAKNPEGVDITSAARTFRARAISGLR